MASPRPQPQLTRKQLRENSTVGSDGMTSIEALNRLKWDNSGGSNPDAVTAFVSLQSVTAIGTCRGFVRFGDCKYGALCRYEHKYLPLQPNDIDSHLLATGNVDAPVYVVRTMHVDEYKRLESAGLVDPTMLIHLDIDKDDKNTTASASGGIGDSGSAASQQLSRRLWSVYGKDKQYWAGDAVLPAADVRASAIAGAGNIAQTSLGGSTASALHRQALLMSASHPVVMHRSLSSGGIVEARLDHLPPSIMVLLASFCSDRCLAMLAIASRTMKAAVGEKAIWQPKLEALGLWATGVANGRITLGRGNNNDSSSPAAAGVAVGSPAIDASSSSESKQQQSAAQKLLGMRMAALQAAYSSLPSASASSSSGGGSGGVGIAVNSFATRTVANSLVSQSASSSTVDATRDRKARSSSIESETDGGGATNTPPAAATAVTPFSLASVDGAALQRAYLALARVSDWAAALRFLPELHAIRSLGIIAAADLAPAHAFAGPTSAVAAAAAPVADSAASTRPSSASADSHPHLQALPRLSPSPSPPSSPLATHSYSGIDLPAPTIPPGSGSGGNGSALHSASSPSTTPRTRGLRSMSPLQRVSASGEQQLQHSAPNSGRNSPAAKSTGGQSPRVTEAYGAGTAAIVGSARSPKLQSRGAPSASSPSSPLLSAMPPSMGSAERGIVARIESFGLDDSDNDGGGGGGGAMDGGRGSAAKDRRRGHAHRNSIGAFGNATAAAAAASNVGAGSATAAAAAGAPPPAKSGAGASGGAAYGARAKSAPPDPTQSYRRTLRLLLPYARDPSHPESQLDRKRTLKRYKRRSELLTAAFRSIVSKPPASLDARASAEMLAEHLAGVEYEGEGEDDDDDDGQGDNADIVAAGGAGHVNATAAAVANRSRSASTSSSAAAGTGSAAPAPVFSALSLSSLKSPNKSPPHQPSAIEQYGALAVPQSSSVCVAAHVPATNRITDNSGAALSGGAGGSGALGPSSSGGGSSAADAAAAAAAQQPFSTLATANIADSYRQALTGGAAASASAAARSISGLALPVGPPFRGIGVSSGMGIVRGGCFVGPSASGLTAPVRTMSVNNGRLAVLDRTGALRVYASDGSRLAAGRCTGLSGGASSKGSSGGGVGGDDPRDVARCCASVCSMDFHGYTIATGHPDGSVIISELSENGHSVRAKRSIKYDESVLSLTSASTSTAVVGSSIGMGAGLGRSASGSSGRASSSFSSASHTTVAFADEGNAVLVGRRPLRARALLQGSVPVVLYSLDKDEAIRSLVPRASSSLSSLGGYDGSGIPSHPSSLRVSGPFTAIVGYTDGCMRLWDLRTYNEVRTIRLTRDPVRRRGFATAAVPSSSSADSSYPDDADSAIEHIAFREGQLLEARAASMASTGIADPDAHLVPLSSSIVRAWDLRASASMPFHTIDLGRDAIRVVTGLHFDQDKVMVSHAHVYRRAPGEFDPALLRQHGGGDGGAADGDAGLRFHWNHRDRNRAAGRDGNGDPGGRGLAQGRNDGEAINRRGDRVDRRVQRRGLRFAAGGDVDEELDEPEADGNAMHGGDDGGSDEEEEVEDGDNADARAGLHNGRRLRAPPVELGRLYDRMAGSDIDRSLIPEYAWPVTHGPVVDGTVWPPSSSMAASPMPRQRRRDENGDDEDHDDDDSDRSSDSDGDADEHNDGGAARPDQRRPAMAFHVPRPGAHVPQRPATAEMWGVSVWHPHTLGHAGWVPMAHAACMASDGPILAVGGEHGFSYWHTQAYSQAALVAAAAAAAAEAGGDAPAGVSDRLAALHVLRSSAGAASGGSSPASGGPASRGTRNQAPSTGREKKTKPQQASADREANWENRGGKGMKGTITKESKGGGGGGRNKRGNRGGGDSDEEDREGSGTRDQQQQAGMRKGNPWDRPPGYGSIKMRRKHRAAILAAAEADAAAGGGSGGHFAWRQGAPGQQALPAHVLREMHDRPKDWNEKMREQTSASMQPGGGAAGAGGADGGERNSKGKGEKGWGKSTGATSSSSGSSSNDDDSEDDSDEWSDDDGGGGGGDGRGESYL